MKLEFKKNTHTAAVQIPAVEGLCFRGPKFYGLAVAFKTRLN